MYWPGNHFAWKDFFRRLYHEWEKDRLDDTAGILAFWSLLAIFPFLLFVVSLASIFLDPQVEVELVNEIRRVAPREAADILASRVHALAAGQSPALVTLSGLGTIWTASGGISALMGALNIVYDVEETRPFWKRRGLSLLVTIGAAVLVVIASVIAVAAPVFASLFGSPFDTLILALRLPVAALFMMLVLAILYYVLPNAKLPFRLITPGSVAAVLLWLVASLGFSFYTSHFASYEVAYGALGGVIVLLLWMWLSSIAVLLGAEINSVLLALQSPEDRQTLAAPSCPPPTSAPAAPPSSTNPAAPRSTAPSAKPPTPRA